MNVYQRMIGEVCYLDGDNEKTYSLDDVIGDIAVITAITTVEDILHPKEKYVFCQDLSFGWEYAEGVLTEQEMQDAMWEHYIAECEKEERESWQI